MALQEHQVRRVREASLIFYNADGNELLLLTQMLVALEHPQSPSVPDSEHSCDEEHSGRALERRIHQVDKRKLVQNDSPCQQFCQSVLCLLSVPGLRVCQNCGHSCLSPHQNGRSCLGRLWTWGCPCAGHHVPIQDDPEMRF